MQDSPYERILHAACQLMHARGYADVGVAAICQQARVNKGSFYHFFPSKQALTLSVLETQFTDMKSQLLDEAFDERLAPLDRLRRLCEGIYAFQSHLKDLTGHVIGCPFGNLAAELATRDEAMRSRLDDIFNRLQAAFHLSLTQAVAEGALPVLDVDATASAMFAYLEGVMLLAKTRNDPELLRTLLPAMLQIHLPLATGDQVSRQQLQ